MAFTMEDNLEDMLDQLLIFDAEKAQKSKAIVKTKVICTDSLLKKYYQKGLLCKEQQNSLLSLKELYRQSCIDRMELREKCTGLEEEIKKMQEANKEIQGKHIAAENQYEGMQSHSKQLELLIKENETTIQSLKIENNLERLTSRDSEKKFAALQKENDFLIKNIRSIRDIVFGKKKATKDIKSFLNKYGKFNAGNDSQEENSSDEADTFDDCLSPILDPGVYNNILGSPAGKNNKIAAKLQNVNINGENVNNRDDNDHDSQSSNEIVSSDTGRGSSLAFSDSDKCSVLSPEYFVDHSPLSAEVTSNKDDKMVVSIATSPIHLPEFTCVATSPIIFEDLHEQMDTETSVTGISQDNIMCNPSVPIVMVDRVVSPIFVTQYVDRSTTTDIFKNCDVGTSPLRLDNRTSNCIHVSDHSIQEKECLDINNSNNLSDENSNDGEIQMILDTMRFNKKLITPIPTTPAKPRSEGATNIAIQTSLNIPGVCLDVVPTKDDFASLLAKFSMLEQELKSVKKNCNLNSSIIHEIVVNGDAQKMLKDTYLMDVNEKTNQFNNQPEPKAALVQLNNEMSTDTKAPQKDLNFKGKISKMKELFDDASPPTPSDGLLQPPIMPLYRSPSPSSRVIHSPAVCPSVAASTMLLPSVITCPISPASVSSIPVSPPLVPPFPVSPSSKSPPPMSPPPMSPPVTSSPPVSPPPVSPLSSPAVSDGNMSNINADSNRSFKSKERLHFEDFPSNQGALLDEGVSDQEILYEHEIVVELTPDSHESDRRILHKILEEQQRLLDQELKSEDVSTETKTVAKPKKMTKLEKLRKNMVPKSKIKSKLQARKPKAKLRIQPKRLTANKERIISSDCVIDARAAYEKARKVMAELKSKEKVSSKPILDRMYRTPEKNTGKSLEGDQSSLLDTVVLNEVGIHTRNESSRREDIVVVDKVSPLLVQTTISKKDCTVESGNDLINEYSNKITPKSIKTSKTALEGNDVSISDFKRTCNLNKCTDVDDATREYNSEVTHFNTNHLTSPSLKSYGRNRTAHKGETKCINNNNTLTQSFVQHDNPVITKEENNTDEIQPEIRKGLKRPSLDKPDIVRKRILRSASIQQAQIEEENLESTAEPNVEKVQKQSDIHKDIISYDDLDLFENMEVNRQPEPQRKTPNISRVSVGHARNSDNGILCIFLDKYGCSNGKKTLKISENIVNAICKQLDDSITSIQKLPTKDTKHGMDKLVKDLQSRSPKHLLAGLIKYLKEPARKAESYNKINTPPAPPMTKVEQILIYVVAQLDVCCPDYNIVENILGYIEYTLFMLNRTPEFDVIDTLSHFYAVLCRYNKNRNRLRLFIIDAMYCLHFKAVPLIKQCLDVWMHILPLAHMGMAKSPLVTCLVYLLHFFKCEDRFNRVQDIRNILHRKYFYEVTEWNEPGILEMFRNSIKELRDIPGEKKMLRMALIILAKRNGARWCQANIIKNMLLPIIDEAGVPDRIKHFCVALLGPLLKPYPMDMKVNCEIVMNQLFDMLKQNPSSQMEEAIFTSLIYMSRHNQHRVIKALLCWRPENISSEFEDLLKNYVKERPVKSWKQTLSKIFIRE